MEEKYLPIGSVVMLKGGKKRIMVVGYLAYDESDKTKVFDYSACLYPEGVISSKQTLLFNHEQIEKIYSVGFSDDEQKEFSLKLKDIASKNVSK